MVTMATLHLGMPGWWTLHGECTSLLAHNCDSTRNSPQWIVEIEDQIWAMAKFNYIHIISVETPQYYVDESLGRYPAVKYPLWPNYQPSEDLDFCYGSVRICEIYYHLMGCWLSLSCRLEDPDALEVKDYVAKQAELAAEVLKECHTRPTLKKKVTSLYNYPRYGCPYKRGKYFFYHYNSGLQAQSTMYIQVCPENAFEILTPLYMFFSEALTSIMHNEWDSNTIYLIHALESGLLSKEAWYLLLSMKINWTRTSI